MGIGVAVAVNVVDKTTLASLGTSSHTVNGLDITARQYGNPATPVVDDYETTATSGAGGSKVGIAGSLALNLINATTTAHTLGNVNAGAGASSITADQRITAKATAAPSGNGANGGKVGGYFAGANMLLLHTTGAKSGEPRTNPLVYTTDGDHLVIIASKGGADSNPDWYYNLLANPNVAVEVGSERFQARATTVTEEPERSRLYALMVAHRAGFAEYEQKTSRKIPAVVLERVG